MSLQVTLLSQAEFDLLRDDWNALLQRSESNSVFLRWEWIHTWWTLFGAKRRLFILAVKEDGLLRGLAPFYIEREGALGTNVLRLCSDELSPDYLDLIADTGREADVAAALVGALDRRRDWDVLAFDNLRAESRLLTHPLVRARRPTIRRDQMCPFIRIEGPFEAYYREKSSRAGVSVRRKLKTLRDRHGLTHTVAADEETLTTGLKYLFLLHEKRAREKGIETAFIRPTVRRFHEEISRTFLAQGMLNLHYLTAGGVPVSARYGFRYAKKLYDFQSGYDPDWSKFSVGSVILYLVVERAFADGLDEVDFLKGSEKYKDLWSNAAREEMHLTVYNRSLLGRVWQGANGLKPALRTVRRRWQAISARPPQGVRSIGALPDSGP